MTIPNDKDREEWAEEAEQRERDRYKGPPDWMGITEAQLRRDRHRINRAARRDATLFTVRFALLGVVSFLFGLFVLGPISEWFF